MSQVRLVLLALTLGSLTHATAQRPPSVEITATQQGYTAPAQLPSGFVQLNFRNTGSAPAEMQLFKLKSGVSADALKRAISAFAMGMQTHQGDSAALEAALINASELYGGPPMLGPKATFSLTVNLEPGTYAISNVSTNNDEKNPQALANTGFFKTFTVVRGNNMATAPKAAYMVQLADFALALPPMQVAAGTHMWEIVNHGRQPHFMMIAPLKAGKTADDVMKFMAAGEQAQGEPPVNFELATGIGVLSPGKANYANLTLKPGTYFTACFVTDPATHKPHALLGMTRFITVR
ncbi:hypothetical protein DEDE109153_00880 [Deinococcus deserti]|uniref:Uncharacterized protein n=1 Tax=Deinococcus deserti (strain DSM 17065 / CIP 109153 / LMG 22923 / VCD115) TaxID=546414 RepID=C1CVR1_DEIDV|nr:hypothetical protein [Deinococcus deserti]ACO46278.1 Hypothetical protein, precursor [Deinococcus deserti VCD115]